MSYGEVAVVMVVAVVVLGPKELKMAAFYVGKLWRMFQSTKAFIRAELSNVKNTSPTDPHV